MNSYRQNIWADMEMILSRLGPLSKALDFGCGDGWFSKRVTEAGFAGELVSLDVKRRHTQYVEPLIYDGGRGLPFSDRSFDLVFSVDVLHHCDSPLDYLAELSRVSSRYLLIKDHTYSGLFGKMALAVMDEIGNRRFGIPSNYAYQRGWEWEEFLQQRGWSVANKKFPERCHIGVLGTLTNQLQYISLYERVS
ncbi:Methyltransferase domain-containing protein [Microbulbifer donghaiensis]|uniref:Methyltransferase domain-containing protein n=1 Tax=Microbulbifer donghaiensis TaxID=494016 RepID=A0A1M4XRD0_9GAMM|nr:class I SAM-dependent methyltransferase [Microbulbifer donghaiensis]SHE95802.1 Methyltransferase domain-containing protein [Microbulbifer donghaiensis]